MTRSDGHRMHAQHGRNYTFFGAPVGLMFTIDRGMAFAAIDQFRIAATIATVSTDTRVIRATRSATRSLWSAKRQVSKRARTVGSQPLPNPGPGGQNGAGQKR